MKHRILLVLVTLLVSVTVGLAEHLADSNWADRSGHIKGQWYNWPDSLTMEVGDVFVMEGYEGIIKKSFYLAFSQDDCHAAVVVSADDFRLEPKEMWRPGEQIFAWPEGFQKASQGFTVRYQPLKKGSHSLIKIKALRRVTVYFPDGTRWLGH